MRRLEITGGTTQMDINQAADTRTPPTPAERKNIQKRRISNSKVIAERVKEAAIKLTLQGLPVKQIIPRVITEVQGEERRV